MRKHLRNGAFLLFLCLGVFFGSSAWGAQPIYPYPMVANTDIFGAGEVFGEERGNAFRHDSATVALDGTSWRVDFGALSPDAEDLDLLLLRTLSPRGNWTLSFTHTGALLGAQDVLEISLEGDLLTASPVRLISGDVAKDIPFSWNFGSETQGISQALLKAAYYTVSGDEETLQSEVEAPFSLVLVTEPGTFVLGYAAGAEDPPPSAFRYLALSSQEDKTLAMNVFATTTDTLWLRFLNMGKNGVRLSAPGFTSQGISFAGGGVAGAGVFPGYLELLRSNLITGMTFALAVAGEGGYELQRRYSCTVTVVPYYPLDLAPLDPLAESAAGARIVPAQMEMPEGMSSVEAAQIGTNNRFGEADPAAYAELVPGAFRACYFDIGAQRFDPEDIIGLPLVVTWSITSQDLALYGGLSGSQIASFFDSLKAPKNVTEKVFAHLRPYKQFAHIGAADLVGESGNYWPFFFETGYNPEDESVTLQFRMVLLDDERSGVTLAKKEQVGFFPLFDGARDGVFRDPLALSYRSTVLSVPAGADVLGVLPDPLPTGTITPAAPSPTSGASGGGGGGSGCNAGFGGLGAMVLFLLPLGLLFGKI